MERRIRIPYLVSLLAVFILALTACTSPTPATTAPTAVPPATALPTVPPTAAPTATEPAPGAAEFRNLGNADIFGDEQPAGLYRPPAVFAVPFGFDLSCSLFRSEHCSSALKRQRMNSLPLSRMPTEFLVRSVLRHKFPQELSTHFGRANNKVQALLPRWRFATRLNPTAMPLIKSRPSNQRTDSIIATIRPQCLRRPRGGMPWIFITR